MRIKEFSIDKYGPLSNAGSVRLSGFNLFYGENEDGKTLTLEALIRMLLGKDRKVFPDIDRVEENPEGYVVITMDTGEELKIPEKGYVTDLTGIFPNEYRNLFVIRNSDLSIVRETEFYGDVTERLTGLRTYQIQAVKSHLRALGDFTEKLDTVNTRESHYLKKRLQQARELVDECESLLQQAHSQGYNTQEEKLVRMQKHYQLLEAECSDLEKARLREKYETGQAHLTTISALLEKLEELKNYQDEDLGKWERVEGLIEEKTQEQAQLHEQLASLETERLEETERLKEFRNHQTINHKRKQDIEDHLKPALREWGEQNKALARVNAGKPFFKAVMIFFAALALLSLAALFWQPHLYVIISAAAGGTVALVLALLYHFRFIKPRGELRQWEQQVLNQAGELGIPGEGIPQIQEQIQRFEEQLQRQQQRIIATEGKLAFLDASITSLREERLKNLEQRLKDGQRAIELIRHRYQVETIDQYRARLQQRKRYEQQLKDAFAVLKSLFQAKGDSVSACIQLWQQEIEQLEVHRGAAGDIQYDEKLLGQKRAEQKTLHEDIETQQRQMREFREQLSDLERRSNETILPEDNFYPCQTLTDLQATQKHLQDFIADVEQRQGFIRLALEIFDDIEHSEQQKVGVLFGEDSGISRFYRQITEGTYEGVYFDAASAGLQVKRRDGKLLSPRLLSSGAYDQLYFAIRLTLGEKLLRNEKGFFILDDPFLKSDSERLKRQLEMLLDISRRGWQIIYFSAKDEVRDALKPYLDSKEVMLLDVGGVDFKVDGNE
ncbi:MAG: AAA family ATPase [Calditrichae bacterium]|nr:AAA family ATPase [Calditrichia bacterium]